MNFFTNSIFFLLARKIAKNLGNGWGKALYFCGRLSSSALSKRQTAGKIAQQDLSQTTTQWGKHPYSDFENDAECPVHRMCSGIGLSCDDVDRALTEAGILRTRPGSKSWHAQEYSSALDGVWMPESGCCESGHRNDCGVLKNPEVFGILNTDMDLMCGVLMQKKWRNRWCA